MQPSHLVLSGKLKSSQAVLHTILITLVLVEGSGMCLARSRLVFILIVGVFVFVLRNETRLSEANKLRAKLKLFGDISMVSPLHEFSFAHCRVKSTCDPKLKSKAGGSSVLLRFDISC
jgi:hypothetical protein